MLSQGLNMMMTCKSAEPALHEYLTVLLYVSSYVIHLTGMLMIAKFRSAEIIVQNECDKCIFHALCMFHTLMSNGWHACMKSKITGSQIAWHLACMHNACFGCMPGF